MLEHPSNSQNHTSRFAEFQEAHAREQRKRADDAPTLFTLYTVPGDGRNAERVARYFDGATIYTPAVGLWKGEVEASEVIEIIGRMSDLQAVVNLAGDIRYALRQDSVLLTYTPIGILFV